MVQGRCSIAGASFCLPGHLSGSFVSELNLALLPAGAAASEDVGGIVHR
jgi:hypothetical protein